MLRFAGLALAFLLMGVSISSAIAADQNFGVTPKRVVVKHRHHHHRAGLYPCPDGYGCYPLYGAYGPYGGPAYWSSFSYLVPSTYAPRP